MPRAGEKAVITFDAEAVLDLEEVKGREDRKALFTVVHKLKELGSRLPSPHMKSLKGEPDLFELRPRQGNSGVRAIYARVETERFVILAIARNKAGFEAATRAARERYLQYDA